MSSPLLQDDLHGDARVDVAEEIPLGGDMVGELQENGDEVSRGMISGRELGSIGWVDFR